MSLVKSFKPIASKSAQVLVLGSMPGAMSLKANQYYAHPRNAFWRVMAEIFRFSAEAAYEARVAALTASGVALWDVLHSCVRAGSLDSAIEQGSRVPNDFKSFFQQHPEIKRVCFNGAEAENSFRRHVLPQLTINGVRYIRLPSTSPAHAVAFEQKLTTWQLALAGDNKAYGLFPQASKTSEV